MLVLITEPADARVHFRASKEGKPPLSVFFRFLGNGRAFDSGVRKDLQFPTLFPFYTVKTGITSLIQQIITQQNKTQQLAKLRH